VTTQHAASELARVKRTFPLWRISVVEDGWEATRGTAKVWAASLGALEAQMRSAQRGVGDQSRTLGRLSARFPGWVIARIESGWTAERRVGTALHFLFRPTDEELASALERAQP